MPPRDPAQPNEAAVQRFVEAFALVLTDAGMQRTAARAFAALLVSTDGSLTAREIAETLQISPSAVSGAVRYLEHVELIRRARDPNERVDHFVLGHDHWYEAMMNESRVFDAMCETLDPGIEAVGPDSDAGQRLAETQEFFAFMREELPRMFQRWRDSRT